MTLQVMQRLLIAFLVSLTIMAYAQTETPTDYAIIVEISPLPEFDASEMTGLNDAGQVVGSVWKDGEDNSGRAVLYDNDSLQDIGTLEEGYTNAYKINNAGQIIGTSTLANGQDRAFIYENGTMTDLGTLGDNSNMSNARGINASGQVVGVAESPTEREVPRGYLWQDGTMTDLGIDIANGINDAGQVVGSKDSYAVLWENGEVTDLHTLEEFRRSSANSVNNNGQVIGTVFANAQGNNEPRFGFLWQDGEMTKLEIPEEYSKAAALDINDAGQVVGYVEDESGEHRFASLWQDGEWIDLNTLLDPALGWQIAMAYDINNAGQITGYGFLNDRPRGFLLTLPAELTAGGQ